VARLKGSIHFSEEARKIDVIIECGGKTCSEGELQGRRKPIHE
jgi:hypothetical protein